MRLQSIIPITATFLVLLIGSCKKDATPPVDPIMDTATDLQNEIAIVSTNTNKASNAYSSDNKRNKLTTPANNATGVPLDQIIKVEFNNNLTASQIAKSTFTLKSESKITKNDKSDDGEKEDHSGDDSNNDVSIIVQGTVSFAGLTAIFTPTSKLNPNTVYTASIISRNFGHSEDGSEKRAYSWNFTTGGGVTTTIPVVTLTDPLNAASGVVFNQPIAVTFSESMDPLTINASTFTIKQGSVVVAGTITYSGTKAIFTPTSNFAPNTVYTITITTGAKDVSGFALLSNYTLSFTTASALDVTPPRVVSADPLNATIGVALSKVIAVNFSESMNSATISATTFTLKQGTTAVAGIVAYSGTKATFTPSATLIAGSVYTGTITTGAKDLAGNALVSNYTFSFTTGAAVDITAPAVTLVDPINNATSVAINKVLSVTFSKPMNASSLSTTTFTLKQGSTLVAGTVAYAASIATFTPSANLVNGAAYTVVITTGVKDLAGNALASNYTFIFTTIAAADITPPTVTLVDPANNASGVAINKVLSVTFSKLMNASTLSTSTFTLKQGSTVIAGTVAYTASKATFSPSANLANGAVYTATITTGAKDVAGNALASNYTFIFTTIAAVDVTPPTVNSTDPLNNATGVATNKVVGVTFSEAMNASTLSASTFTLKQGSTAVAGSVAYAGTTATFTPTNALVAGTVYSATITTGVKDLAGNALTANTAWSFTTAGTPPPPALSFASDVVPVLAMCQNCHTHGWTPSAVASDYYTNLVNSGYVNPASYSTSKMSAKMQGGHPGSGNVSTMNTDKIINWMIQGSKNN